MSRNRNDSCRNISNLLRPLVLCLAVILCQPVRAGDVITCPPFPTEGTFYSMQDNGPLPFNPLSEHGSYFDSQTVYNQLSAMAKRL